MDIPKIITGTDRQLTATWIIGETVTPISVSGAVRFRLVSRDKQTPHTAILTADRNHPDADWPNGEIVLIFPATETVGVTVQGLAEVELQVDDNNEKLGTFFTVNVVKGNIG